MRIISIEWPPVAMVMAIAYGVLGLSAFFIYAIGSDEKFTLPFGIVLPLFHLNFNFSVPRTTDPISNAFLCLGAVFSYALTGWISGIALVLLFNLIAKKVGGINAKYFSVIIDEVPVKTSG